MRFAEESAIGKAPAIQNGEALLPGAIGPNPGPIMISGVGTQDDLIYENRLFDRHGRRDLPGESIDPGRP
jgi:hypothetical protein